MASTFPQSRAMLQALSMPSGRRLARGMSRHSAAAMLVFSVWQAWLTLSMAAAPGGSVLPWIALALLILAAIPFARQMERRWLRLTANAFPCPGLLAAYRRDRTRMWLLAMGIPPLTVALTAALTLAIASLGTIA